MLGCYTVNKDKINYVGNRIYKSFSDVSRHPFVQPSAKNLLKRYEDDKHFYHLHQIDNAIHEATIRYFNSIKAQWCNLPLTTKMISSPGEIYAGKKLNYTTDALPITVKWFDNEDIYLSESSQFYLELRLILEKIPRVYSIYQSFRKEQADFSHLSEFQHIEFEGKVSFEKNTQIFIGLIREITNHLLDKYPKELSYYLTEEEIKELENSFNKENITTLSFKKAMSILYENLGNNKYKNISLKNFGSLEEVALTRILNKHCLITEYPLEEIPFYHDLSFTDVNGKKYAKNADFIFLGYREVVGSGQRITDPKAIKEKALYFNLPKDDYDIYINMRKSKNYKTTCGFGLGWQRYTQWLLKMPFIWQLSHTPRGHFTPNP